MLARAPGSHSLLTCMSSSRSRARTLARVALGRLQSLGGASALRRFTRQYDVLLEPYDALVFPGFADDDAWIREFER